MTRVRPPRMVRVGGKRYRLEAVTDRDESMSRGSAYSCMGTADYYRGLVRYRAAGDEVSVDEEADTVLHEVLHLIMVAGGDDHGGTTSKRDVEIEGMVSRLAGGLLDTLRRNPALVQYLVEEAPLDG